MITSNLANYYDTIKSMNSSQFVDADSILVDGRLNHSIQIQERLHFFKYLLKEGQLCMSFVSSETY